MNRIAAAAEPGSGAPPRAAAPAILRAALIVLATGLVYAPCVHGGWLWDDLGEVAGNPDLRSAAGLRAIWFHPASLDYYPLKSTVQWVQYQLWRGDVAGYHLTNIALHAAAALLLWNVLRKLGASAAWVGGLLFAVHPLAVASVAWISELKNTLSLPLLLLAFGAWIDWDGAREGHAPRRRAATYLRSLGCFLAAMLCKTSGALFPAILLLHAWWKRGRVGRSDLVASLPFLAVSLVLGLVTLHFQLTRAIGEGNLVPVGLASRVAAAGLAAAFYFSKCVLPVGLAPVYPRWSVEPPAIADFLPWAAFAAIAAWLWLRSRRAPSAGEKPIVWERTTLFGLGLFLLGLLPALGLVPMAYQRLSWVADHLAYVSLAGVVGLAAAGIGAGFLDHPRPFRWPWLVLAGIAGLLGAEAREIAKSYRGELPFWTRAVAANPRSWLALNNRGVALRNAGSPAAAADSYGRALAIRPEYPEAEENLGAALSDLGRIDDAMGHFERALAPGGGTRDPAEVARVRDEMGNALARNGRADEAPAQYREALRIDPGLPEAHYDLGLALAQAGNLADAIPSLQEAVRLNPDYVAALINLANALSQSGRLAEAVPLFERALRLDPGNATAHYNFGLALRSLGRADEARVQWDQAGSLAKARQP